MLFYLNSKPYVTPEKSPIIPVLLDPLATAIRDTGLQRRSDSTDLGRFVFNDWTKYGIGFPKMRREIGYGICGLRDADCETRWPDMITLPLLDQDATDQASCTVSRMCVEYGGGFYVCGENSTPQVGIAPWAGATTTWGTFATPAAGRALQDACVVRTNLGLLYWGGTSDTTLYFQSYTGSAWNGQITVGTTVGATATNGNDANIGKMVMLADVLYVVRHSGGTVIVATSTDGGAIFADFAAAQTVSENYVQGMTTWLDLYGDKAPVFHGFGGVWAIDTSASVVQLLWKKAEACVNDFEGEGMAVAGGRLYVPTKDGGMDEGELVGEGITSVRHIRAPRLPTARQGYIRWMQPAGDWIFCAYDKGRNSGGQPSILAWDFTRRLENDGQGVWHSILSRDTASKQVQWLYISGLDDGTPRLHFAERSGLTGDLNSTTDERFLVKPLTDPSSGVTLYYETTGYIEVAEDDMSDPHSDGVMYSAYVEADDLGATATTSTEYITHEYGVNGAAWTNANLGNYLSGTKKLVFGTTVGVAAKTIRHRLEFYRNTAGTPDTTKTPKLRDFEWRGYKNLNPGLLAYYVTIDLKATADNQKAPISAVISDIETCMSSTTLLAFKYADDTTRYVRLMPGQLGRFGAEEDTTTQLGRRTGTVTLLLKRILA